MDKTSLHAFEQVARWIRQASERTPFVVGIGGPGGCGKTTLSHWLLDQLPGSACLPLDDFRLPREQRRERDLFGSHPDGNDLPRLRTCLQSARTGEVFERPVFDHATGRPDQSVTVTPGRILICDGEIAAHTGLRSEFDGLIVVEAHWRTQLNTRLTRDLRERHCSLEKAMAIFLQSNLRDYPLHAKGARQAADFVLYRNCKNTFSIKKAAAG